jgi:hypothetical protein
MVQRVAIRAFSKINQAEKFVNKLAAKTSIIELAVVPFSAKLSTQFLVIVRCRG